MLNEGGEEGKGKRRGSGGRVDGISSSSLSSPTRPIRKGGGGGGGGGGKKALGGRAIAALLHQHEGDVEGLLKVIETHVSVFEKQNCAMAFNR